MSAESLLPKIGTSMKRCKLGGSFMRGLGISATLFLASCSQQPANESEQVRSTGTRSLFQLRPDREGPFGIAQSNIGLTGGSLAEAVFRLSQFLVPAKRDILALAVSRKLG